MDVNDDNLWDMSDEELESAFKEAQASDNSPETAIEEDLDIADSDVSEDEVAEEFEEDTEKVDDSPEQSEEVSDDSDDHDPSSDEGEDSDVPDEVEGDDTAEESDKTEELVPQVHKFKANGRDYEFTSEELVEQFPKIFGQAMDYTKKMQTIKPWRKTIDALEGAELSHEDVSLMIDVMKGDKDAITEVLKRTGVDTLDIDTEKDSSYVPKSYGRDANAIAMQDIVNDISNDPEYSTTKSILSEGGWDEKSWSVISENPEMVRLLHQDVKTGMYATLQPVAEKLKVFDGGKKSDLEYYKEAAANHFTAVAKQEAAQKEQEAKEEQERLAQVKAQAQKRTAVKEASVKRKAAAPTKVASGGNKVIDYLDTDEAFEEWYKKLQDEM